MRIVLASQQYPPETADGGIGTQTYAKAHGLAARGHDVIVVSHSQDAHRHEYADGPVSVVRVPGFDYRMPMHTTEAWWLTYSTMVATEIAALNRKAPVDLVDFPEYGAEGFTWLLNQTPDLHVPTVVHLHGSLAMLSGTIGWPDAASEFFRTGSYMEGTCVRLADAVLSSSHCSADWCTRAYGIARESIAILHTGVDVEHFSPRQIETRKRPTIAFVGRVTESKGVATLVNAVVRLAVDMPSVQLRLIGHVEIGFREWIAACAASSGSRDLVDFVGYRRRHDLPNLLTSADVFAAPSKYEGGPGFVYLEAMACGLPVIACSGSGAAEAVTDGEDGFLVPPSDVDALVDVLRRLLSDTTLRAAMGSAARRNAVLRADAKQCLQRIESFYQSVVARHSGLVDAVVTHTT